jgi:hypothetical protein
MTLGEKQKYSLRNVASQSKNLVPGGNGNLTMKSTWKYCEVSKTSELRGILGVDSRLADRIN